MDSSSDSTRSTFVDYSVSGAAYGAFAGLVSSGIFLIGLALPFLLNSSSNMAGFGTIACIGILGSMTIGAAAGAIIGSVFYFKQNQPSRLKSGLWGLLAAGLPAIPFIIDTAGREIINQGAGGTLWLRIWIFYLLSALWVGTRFSNKAAKQD